MPDRLCPCDVHRNASIGSPSSSSSPGFSRKTEPLHPSTHFDPCVKLQSQDAPKPLQGSSLLDRSLANGPRRGGGEAQFAALGLLLPEVRWGGAAAEGDVAEQVGALGGDGGAGGALGDGADAGAALAGQEGERTHILIRCRAAGFVKWMRMWRRARGAVLGATGVSAPGVLGLFGPG